jgi:anaerobic selenocysteine-containing dehydrogenase
MPANSNPSSTSSAAEMPRRDFLKTSVVAAGAFGAALGATQSPTAQAAEPSGGAARDGEGMKIGVNLEFVRHADKSLAYGIKSAGQIGYKWVEPCFLMGRCLLSNAGYCHVTSLDTDPKEIQVLRDENA